MRVRYLFRDDSREKEGDLAREGFIHFFNCEGSEDELQELDEWCEDNNIAKVVYSGLCAETFYRNIYVKTSQDAVLFKIRWC